jgi:hypothetical protein
MQPAVTKKALIALLSCAVLCTGVLVASRGPAHVAAAADPPAPATAADFAVLAQKQSPGDALPDDVKRATLGRDRASSTVDSRGIDTPSGHGWAISIDDSLCLVVPDPVDGYGVACTPADIARRRGALVMMGKGGRFDVTLVLPYGAKAARNADGARSPLAAPPTGVVTTELGAGDSIAVTNSAGASTTLPAPVAPAASVAAPTAPADGPQNG